MATISANDLKTKCIAAIELALCGKFEGLHSVSINLPYRITLELLIQNQQIIPVSISRP